MLKAHELLRAALDGGSRENDDGDPYWTHVSRIQTRDPSEVWASLEPFASSDNPDERALVADVLRALGGALLPLKLESVALFRRMLATETAPRVLRAIGYALGELTHPDSVELMLPFARHPAASVRRAVAAALLTHAQPDAVEMLIELSRDVDDEVRDWATFGLGSQLGPADPDRLEDRATVDTPALRDALVARLHDTDPNTRCEAVVGLAMRRDPRVLPVLRDEIAKGPEYSLYLEAARWMAAPELSDALRELAESEELESVLFWEDHGLHEAIAACAGTAASDGSIPSR